jgi:hypothetical protein
LKVKKKMLGGMRVLLPLVLMAIGANCKIEKVELEIQEGNAKFKQQVFIDKAGKYEIIKVPKHNDVSGVTLFSDYEKGYRIQKVPATNSCMVMKLDKSVGTPKEHMAGIENAKNVFPSNRYMVEKEQLFITGPVALASEIGKKALRFCGATYDISHALAYKGNNFDGYLKNVMAKAIKRKGLKPPVLQDELDDLIDAVKTESVIDELKAVDDLQGKISTNKNKKEAKDELKDEAHEANSKAIEVKSDDKEEIDEAALDALANSLYSANRKGYNYDNWDISRWPLSCGKGTKDEKVVRARKEMQRCGYNMKRLTPYCTFRPYNTCLYFLKCVYSWNANGDQIIRCPVGNNAIHTYNTNVSCCMECDDGLMG